MRLGVLVVAMVLAGCGPECDDAAAPADAIGRVHGAWIAVSADHPVETGGLLEETERALTAAEALWDTPPWELRGWTIRFQDFSMPCGSMPYTSGCTLRESACGGTILVQPTTCRTTVLIHEVGHITEGAGHSDPRYSETDAIGATMCM